jgi:crossover junction endodeoxyribonuclease RuvC
VAVILGIDPGSRKTGYGLIDQVGGQLSFLACGTLDVSGKEEMPARLGDIFSGLNTVCCDWHPLEVSIEKVFMARNADSALKLGQARGAALAAVVQCQLPVFEYSARQVKQAVTGVGSADKSQVAAMVCRLLSLEKAPQADAADALAIAICHAHLRTSLMRLSQASGMRSGRLRTATGSIKHKTIGYPG